MAPEASVTVTLDPESRAALEDVKTRLERYETLEATIALQGQQIALLRYVLIKVQAVLAANLRRDATLHPTERLRVANVEVYGHNWQYGLSSAHWPGGSISRHPLRQPD